MRCLTCGREVEAAESATESLCPSCGQLLTPSPTVIATTVIPPADKATARLPDVSAGNRSIPVAPAAPHSLQSAVAAPEPSEPYSVPAPVALPYPAANAAPPAGSYGVPPSPPASPYSPYPPYPPGAWASQGQPPWSPYAAPSAPLLAPLPVVRRRTSRLWLAIAVAALVLVALGGGTFAALSLLRPASAPTVAAASTTTVAATATPTGEVLIYQNTFASDAFGWTSAPPKCALGAGGYHVSSAGCAAPVGSQADVDVTVQAMQLSGPPISSFGIILRNAGRDQRYDIGIDGTGRWSAHLCTGLTTSSDGTPEANCKPLVPATANAAIHPGLNVANTLQVRAKGSTFQVSVNGTQVGTFTDSTYANGTIGLSTAIGVEAVFSNFTVSLVS